jgi:hypothetical protein
MADLHTLVRNRIIETKVVPASEVRFHPYNWRIHPNGQIEAVEGLLKQVGIVQPLIAYHSEREGGALTLIDGALRKGIGGDWPINVTDLTDEEADIILATLHPVGDMAEMDAEKLSNLLMSLKFDPVENEAVADLLNHLKAAAGGVEFEPLDEIDEDDVNYKAAEKILVMVEAFDHYVEAAAAVRVLVDRHPEWKAHIAA